MTLRQLSIVKPQSHQLHYAFIMGQVQECAVCKTDPLCSRLVNTKHCDSRVRLCPFFRWENGEETVSRSRAINIQLQEKSAEWTGHLEHQETGINIKISDTEAALSTVDTRDDAWET